jgi:hypothetical protein
VRAARMFYGWPDESMAGTDEQSFNKASCRRVAVGCSYSDARGCPLRPHVLALRRSRCRSPPCTGDRGSGPPIAEPPVMPCAPRTREPNKGSSSCVGLIGRNGAKPGLRQHGLYVGQLRHAAGSPAVCRDPWRLISDAAVSTPDKLCPGRPFSLHAVAFAILHGRLLTQTSQCAVCVAVRHRRQRLPCRRDADAKNYQQADEGDQRPLANLGSPTWTPVSFQVVRENSEETGGQRVFGEFGLSGARHRANITCTSDVPG